ncbi:MAG: polysaccharide deacetylase family protein, partial [Myxococcota bacterium]|nr:polysaccharide deacetylase family protein [Myxococcota bacterium]
LRECTADLGPAVASCTVGLAALHDAPAAPLMRRVLRESQDPDAVGTAALAIAAFGDTFSRDLVALSLAEGRGGWPAAAALARAFSQMEGPWAEVYLAYGATVAPDVTSRALAASQAWPLAEEKWRYEPPITSALLGAVRDWWRTDVPMEAARAGARGAIAALSRDALGCELLVKHVTDRATEGTTAHAASLMGAAGPRCRARVVAAMRSIAPSLQQPHPLLADIDPLAPSAPWTGALDGLSWWYATLTVMGEQAGVVLDEDARAALADRLSMAEADRALAPGQWGVNIAPRLLVGAPTYTRMSKAQLAERHGGGDFPDDFYGYNPLLDQPDWWPQNLHVTIDDGPRLSVLPDIVDSIERAGVRVDFFFVGVAVARRWLAQREKTERVLRRILDAGHAVSFHSMNHVTQPSLHLTRWEPDQFADSVALYRHVISTVAGRSVPITHGRLPGGMGLHLPWVKRSFWGAGLHEHVHWNAGPPYWVKGSTAAEVAGQACGMAARDKPVVILLHEYSSTAGHLDAFFRRIRENCPATDAQEIWAGVPALWPPPREI